jgi:hypothetical protein
VVTSPTSVPIYLPNREATETVLHHVIKHTEKAVENREVTLGAFLDIEGAFDRNSFYITTNAPKQLGLEHNLFMGW